MAAIIHQCEQGSQAWFDLRKGIPTSSEFECLMKRGRDGKSYSATRRTYMLQLAGETITGEPPEGFTSIYTERGKRLEPEARDLYAMLTDTTPQEVGFITNFGAGTSTDSLIGADGILEIKSKKPALICDAIDNDKFLEEHQAQCQGSLWVAEREWIDLVLYWPGMPPFIKRAYRDETYIASLAAEVGKFNDELAALVAKVRAYGEAPAALAA